LPHERSPVDLLLDWRPQCTDGELATALDTLRLNERPLTVGSRARNHLRLPARALTPGRNVVEIAWIAPIGAAGSAIARYVDPEDGSKYVHTLFVPADASSVFPCFEQPDLKGRFELIATVAMHWTVVSNAPLERVVAQARTHTLQFRETEPISTYAFAFAAGPWTALSARTDADATRLWVRRSQRRRALAHAENVLRLNREAVRYCAHYFDHPFPFAKYDLVLVPEFPYRGMEHAGATFLNESAVLLPASHGRRDAFRRAQLVFHETAHQWMGDLVTMRWFDDLWLKEGFANFIAYKLAARMRAPSEARVEFLALEATALRTDQTPGTQALHAPLADLATAKTVYGSIVYAKAPAMLRAIEAMLGAMRFRRAVRYLVRRHAYGAADSLDLILGLKQVSDDTDLARIRLWIFRPGVYRLRVRSVSDLLSMGEQAYVAARFHPSAIAGVAHDLRELRHPAHRMRVWQALWQTVMDAELAPLHYIEVVLARLGSEREPVIAESVLRNLATALHSYLDIDNPPLAQAIEQLLWAGATSPQRADTRSAWLDAYIELATTPSGLERLHLLLNAAQTTLGGSLPLETRMRIAAMLIVRGDPVPAATIARLLDATPDPGRFALLLAAAEPSPARKRVVFQRYLEETTLPEPWITASLALFHHPSHHASTRPLLSQALRALPSLFAARKIFFVEQWLAACMDGQRDRQALTIVQAFVRRQALAPNLRRKLLEHADRLERTVRIRARFPARTRVVTKL